MNDMDYSKIIDYYYPEDDELRRLLLAHSRAVADKALRICRQHPELGADSDFVEAAAMLHDIGIRECNAPGILCHGTRPYIQHGLAGAEMIHALRAVQGRCATFKVQGSRFNAQSAVQGSRFNAPSDVQGSKFNELRAIQEAFARVCQRHTGAGITRQEVLEQKLPLPLPDDDSEPYMPETIEEQIVCYADKFFSKTKLDREKTMDEVVRSLAKFGTGGVARFQQWAHTFQE